jgi:hypothetical protein
MSSNAASTLMYQNRGLSACNCGYFGRRPGSPPGLPGGGMTGVLPVSGVGARISGSTPEGGHSTPSDLASLSPSGSLLWPVVAPSGTAPCGVAGCIGAQPPVRDGVGGAVWACGVLGDGGACALAAPDAASSRIAIRLTGFTDMRGKRSAGPDVPPKKPYLRLAPRAWRGRIRAIRANSGEREFPHASCFSIRGDTPTPTLPREEREREKGTRFRGTFSFCDSE